MTSQSEQKLSLFALTAMVVGSMVGAGIFSLPRTFAAATGPFGAIIAWCVAGGGMYLLARVFQALAERKPDLDAGVYAYARAGFGDYPGFLSAFGYWIGSCIGNVSYWVLIKSTLGCVLPGLRRWQYGDCDRGRLDRDLALSFYDPKGRPAGGRHQYDRDDSEDRSHPGLYPDPDLCVQERPFPGKLLGWKGRDNRSFRAGPRDDAGYGVCLPRHRRCKRIFALREEALRCGCGHDFGFRRRAMPAGARYTAAVCAARTS